MKNIQEIPISELERDKVDSLNDIEVCRAALRIGIESYSGGSVRERLEVNEKIVKKIDEEISRRLGEAKNVSQA